MSGFNFLGISFVLFNFLVLALGNPPLQIKEIEQFPSANPLSNSLRAPANRDYLPTTVTPLAYNIFLRPVLDEGEQWEQFSCPGTVNILIQCNNATNLVTLHGHHTHQINNMSLVQVSNNQSIVILTHSYEASQQFHHIGIDGNLIPGEQYNLFIDFISRVSNTSNQGLYLSRYTNDAGEEKRVATTQFEEIGAREPFPCFDEPRLKANITIALARKPSYNTLSSSAQSQTGVPDPNVPGWVIDYYKPTVKMSTYLLAIIVSEYTCEKAADDIFPGRPVQACGTPDWKTAGALSYSATTSAKILAFLENTFNNTYPMHKMDSAAIHDQYFGPGAMENWGLNIYKASYLLYWPGQSLESDRRRTSSVLTHELAHQWWGNLVTCKYWSGIWLNEGFATYVATFHNNITPEFDSVREHLWDVQKALAFDIGVNIPIFGSTESTITYSKGGSIIRMMEIWMGKALLIEALSAYLTEFSFDSAEQDNLFEVLNRFAKRDGVIPDDITMKDIMDTWTLQTGYPLIKVSKGGSERIIISQQEYLPIPQETGAKSEKAFDENSLWEVPIVISTQNADAQVHNISFWLSQNTALTTHEADTSSWILLNPDAMVFCRVQYDEELLTLLVNQLSVNHTVFSGLSRSQLIDDYFSFAFLGHEKIENALRLTKHMVNERDHIVWTTLFTALSNSKSNLPILASSTPVQDYLRPRVEGVLNEIGVESKTDTGSIVIFRALVLDWANTLQSQTFVDAAVNLVNAWRQNETANRITVDYQPVVYCGAVAGSADHYNFFLGKYNDASSTASEKAMYLNALACATETDVIQNLTASTLNEAFIRQADVTHVLQQVAKTTEGRPIVLNFLTSNFQQLKSRNGNSTEFVNSVTTTLASYYTVQADLEPVLQFIVDNQDEIVNAPVLTRQLQARVSANIKWMTEYGNAMLTWMSENI